MGAARYTRGTLLRELALIAAAAFYCLPFFMLVAIALETTEQAYKSPLSLHWPPHFGNFPEAWNTAGGRARPRAAEQPHHHALERRRPDRSRLALRLHDRPAPGPSQQPRVSGVRARHHPPFQLAIIPLFVAMRDVGLVGNYLGMIVLNIGLLMPLTVFLYMGFIRALPRDYEEAARVDGAGILRTYVKVVFPLLWPVTATVAVLTGIVVWNEFFIALVFLSGSDYQTLPVALYAFVGEYITRWNIIFAGVAIAIAPIVVFYLFAQRHLMRGFSSGVKG